jgi:transposase InsO family protein
MRSAAWENTELRRANAILKTASAFFAAEVCAARRQVYREAVRLSGFAYGAFVIGACAPRILGWRVAATMATSMVLDSIERAVWTRQQEGGFDLKDVVHQRSMDRYTPRSGSLIASPKPASSPPLVRSAASMTTP